MPPIKPAMLLFGLAAIRPRLPFPNSMPNSHAKESQANTSKKNSAINTGESGITVKSEIYVSKNPIYTVTNVEEHRRKSASANDFLLSGENISYVKLAKRETMSASEIHEAEWPLMHTIAAMEGINAAAGITVNLGWQGSLCFRIPCSSQDAIREAATMAQCKTMWCAKVITAIETMSGTPIKNVNNRCTVLFILPSVCRAETPVSFLKIRDRAVKIFVGIIGPQRIRKIEFGVGGLPQQKIA